MRKALFAVAAAALLAVPAASRAQEGAAEEAAPAAPEQPAAEQGTAEQGTAKQSTAEQSTAEQGTAKQSTQQSTEKHGISLKLGLGVGYGLPMGDAEKNEALSNTYGGEIPIELEASYRFTHAISAGVYVGYGIGLVSSKEVEGLKASDYIDSIASLRFGVQGEYEFGKVGPAIPFATLRVGYVTESIKEDAGTSKVSGWEYATLVAGADFEVAKSFAVGPFVSFSLGQYTAAKPAGGESASIPSGERAMHEWLTIGLRGTFAL